MQTLQFILAIICAPCRYRNTWRRPDGTNNRDKTKKKKTLKNKKDVLPIQRFFLRLKGVINKRKNVVG